MRAAAILGPGVSPRQLAPFQKNSGISWHLGLPATSSDADAILIFGGDGTIHRHLPRLLGLQLPVLIVPCGSGNDFARALNLRSVHDAHDAWEKFIQTQSNEKRIDLGVIRNDKNICHYFCCAGGVGLDGEIARRANALPRWLRAHGGYALSLIPALTNFSPIPMHIISSNSPASTRTVTVAVFANAPYYGGGMKIAPHARLDDAKLDLCIVGNLPKLKLLSVFPTIYFGRHLSIREVEYSRTPGISLQTEIPYPVYADGEYVCDTPIEVSVAPQALPVIVP